MIRVGYDHHMDSRGSPRKLSVVMAGTVLGFAWHGCDGMMGTGEVVAVVMPDGDPDAGRPMLVPVRGSKFDSVPAVQPPTAGEIMVVLNENGITGNRGQQIGEVLAARFRFGGTR